MAKLNITRLDGESEADFKRRYGREQMRAYRAAHPKPTKLRGGDAAPRKNSPFTQQEWEALKRQPGESEADWRRRNVRARHRVYVSRNPTAKREAYARYVQANPGKEQARTKKWAADNPEKVRVAAVRYFERNRECRLKALKMWALANPERVKEVRRQWYAANAEKRLEYGRDRRFRVALATPPWADMAAIEAIYEQAARIALETGVPHDVDHEIPIKHPLVCGLHTEANLRIMTARENRVKRNSFRPEDFAR